MSFDAHANFASTTVATAPSPATSGTSLVVAAGTGALLPTPPFNMTVSPASANPTAANAEIIRVTVVSTDTLTITRAQEGTSARTIIVGDQIANTVTAQTLTDVQGQAVAPVIHRLSAVFPFFQAAKTRRVDMALIGDSNAIAATNSGHAQGMQLAFCTRFGMYATDVKAAGPKQGQTGYFAQADDWGSSSIANDALPSSHTQYGVSYNVDEAVNGFMLRPLCLQSGTVDASAETSLHLIPGLLIDTTAHLKWHFDYGTFTATGGSFETSCRRQFTLTFESAFPPTSISTHAGSNGMAMGSLDVPASGGRSGAILSFAYGAAAQTPRIITAPFVSFWQRVEVVDTAAGMAYSVLLYQGGQPTRIAALALQAMTQAAFTEWAAMLTGLQVGDPMACIHIIQGQNDDSDTNQSVGPAPALSSTPAGVSDNHNACIIRLRTLWAAAGYDLKNLYFLLGPYHPQATHLHAPKTAALRALADTTYNVAVMDGDIQSNVAAFTEYGFYFNEGPGSDYHLNGPTQQPAPLLNGYDTWGKMTVDSIAPPAL